MTTANLNSVNDRLLSVENLVVEFGTGLKYRKVQAVSDINFDIRRGETLGIVGESGCGKSTTGRAIMQLIKPTSGRVVFDGQDLGALTYKQMRQVRTKLQIIFQDPISSLNPRRTVRNIVAEPLAIWKRGTREEQLARVDQVLEHVGIDPQRAADSFPHQFSGGQCQRISIARALVLDPMLIICDEPVSALDVSIQAQVLNLLEDLKAQFNLTLMFIAHDLAVVKNISDRVVVMYLGRLCELAPADDLYMRPMHPYTRLLLDSIPVPDPNITVKRLEITGEPPSPLDPPSGCRFHTRCPFASEQCRIETPEMRELRPDHFVACHHPF